MRRASCFFFFILMTSTVSSDALQDFLGSVGRAAVKVLRLFHIPQTPVREIIYAGKEPTRDTYDFVVVGMSPGGCVVASRLTENSMTSVLLVEAGYEDNVITDVPSFNPYTLLTDWSYTFLTEPARGVCEGMWGRLCSWPSGRGPGGGTILNGMIWTRGNYRDYDSWAAEGNEGWSFDEVLPFFKKTERMTIDKLKNSPYHGRDGPVTLSYVQWLTPLLKAFLEAGEYLGFSSIDYNDPRTHIGFSQIQTSTVRGERETAATAYIKPVLKRKNLEITLRSTVTRIVFDDESRKAIGVVYVKEGEERVVYARKEVVLAAGAFNTPQILMLSGIGHADYLSDLGIPVVQELPVGDNLMEHLGMHGLTFLLNKTVNIDILNAFLNIVPNSLLYLLFSDGLYTNPGSEGVAYMKSLHSNDSAERPDFELLLIASGLNNDAGVAFRKTFSISTELYDYTYKNIDGKPTFGIWPMLLYPKSTGTVRLSDTNPLAPVKIVHNFLTEPEDVRTLIRAIRAAIEVGTSPSFQKFGSRLHRVPFPQCRALEFDTDDYWECSVRTMTTQFHHQCCTCGMGRVVDARLKLLGDVGGLRVVDASVMPSIVGAHTQAAAYMIGEKAADYIKEDWSLM